MAFKKIGSPADTVSVLKQDGTSTVFCPDCDAMSAASMDKKAFTEGRASSRCGKCGKSL